LRVARRDHVSTIYQELIRNLREERVCHTDDGMVVNHLNLDEIVEELPASSNSK